MLSILAALLFVFVAIAFETAVYFFDLLPGLKRKGFVHGTAIFLCLMGLVAILEYLL